MARSLAVSPPPGHVRRRDIAPSSSDRMPIRVRLTLAALLLSALPLLGQGAPTRFARVDSAVTMELRRTGTPGAAIALVMGDSVVYARGFGVTSADGGVPVTPATTFRIASVTKVFTAATLVSLAEAGRLDLNAPIGARLPELPDSLRRITAHQLLSHTGGLIMMPMTAAAGDPANALAESMRRVTARAAFAAPAEIFSYSNLGYQLAGRLIEVAGDRPYTEQVQQTILAPLGMAATTFDSAAAARNGLAIGFVDPAAPPPPASAAVGPAALPYAGLYSSVQDLSRFAVAFMNAGRSGGRQVLSPSLVARLTAPAAKFQSGPGDYGYALRLYRQRGLDVVEHGGVDPTGYRSLLYMVPSRRVAVIVLANRAGRRPYALAEAAIDALLPGALESAAAPASVVPMDSAEMSRYAGRYAGGVIVEVSVDNGVLTLHQGAQALPIRKLGSGELVAGEGDGGQRIAFVPGSDGAVKYLHFNMRAFKRI